MKTRHTTIWLAISLFWLLIPARPVLADVAPPSPPAGGNPSPGGEGTQVQMAAETVVLVVRSLNSSSPFYAGDVAEARVTARFTMQNVGPADEKMQVRFPLTKPFDQVMTGINEVTDLTAAVNQSPVPTTRVTTPNPSGSDYPPVPWAAFDVTFPAGQDVLIEVNYTQKFEGYLPYASFTYILETGAGWKGPIGAGDVIVRLPYEVSPQNVTRSAGAQFVGSEIRWHFENLEPTRGDNIDVELVAPYAWRAMLDGRAAVDAQPDDGNAWGTLARAYKNLIRQAGPYHPVDVLYWSEDPVSQEWYRLSVEAYEKAVSLAPQTAKWHAGYAELLWKKSVDDIKQSEPPRVPGDVRTSLVRIAQELHTALALEPQNEQTLQLLYEIWGSVPGVVARSGSQYTFLILTATPTLFLTAAPAASDTPTPLPSATLAPSATAVQPASPTVEPAATVTPPAPTPSPSPRSPSLPFCGAAMAVPLIVAGLMGVKRRQRCEAGGRRWFR